MLDPPGGRWPVSLDSVLAIFLCLSGGLFTGRSKKEHVFVGLKPYRYLTCPIRSSPEIFNFISALSIGDLELLVQLPLQIITAGSTYGSAAGEATAFTLSDVLPCGRMAFPAKG